MQYIHWNDHCINPFKTWHIANNQYHEIKVNASPETIIAGDLARSLADVNFLFRVVTQTYTAMPSQRNVPKPTTHKRVRWSVTEVKRQCSISSK